MLKDLMQVFFFFFLTRKGFKTFLASCIVKLKESTVESTERFNKYNGQKISDCLLPIKLRNCIIVSRNNSYKKLLACVHVKKKKDTKNFVKGLLEYEDLK